MASKKILAILLAVATQAFYSNAMIPSEHPTDQQSPPRKCQCQSQPQEGDLDLSDTQTVHPKNNESPGTSNPYYRRPAPYPYYQIPMPNPEFYLFGPGSTFDGFPSFNSRPNFGGFSSFGQIPPPHTGFFYDSDFYSFPSIGGAPAWYQRNPSNPSPFNGEPENMDTKNNVAKKSNQHTINTENPQAKPTNKFETSTAAPGATVYYQTTDPPRKSSGSGGFNLGPVKFRHEVSREGTSMTTTARKTW